MFDVIQFVLQIKTCILIELGVKIQKIKECYFYNLWYLEGEMNYKFINILFQCLMHNVYITQELRSHKSGAHSNGRCREQRRLWLVITMRCYECLRWVDSNSSMPTHIKMADFKTPKSMMWNGKSVKSSRLVRVKSVENMALRTRYDFIA